MRKKIINKNKQLMTYSSNWEKHKAAARKVHRYDGIPYIGSLCIGCTGVFSKTRDHVCIANMRDHTHCGCLVCHPKRRRKVKVA